MTILILEKLNLIKIFMINLGHGENRRCDMHQIRRENAESASGLGFIDHFHGYNIIRWEAFDFY